jgi:chorismate synthase
MPGNSFGTLFRVTTFGESHGPGIGLILDGVPPLLELDVEEIQKELDRRRPGQSDVTTPRKESDTVEILSGVFEGKTTGAPLAMLIRNGDQRSKDYGNIQELFRPGHADYTYHQKYGIRDHRGGGRSSGRETACRVAAGAVAKKFLSALGVRIVAYTKRVGPISAETIDYDVIETNAVRCPDAVKAQEMEALIKTLRGQGDSIGGVIEAVVHGCPVGLGEPCFDKLPAILGHALFSIGTVKGVEFGDGFDATLLKGSENNDAFYAQDGHIQTRTNHAGGTLGGISNGEDIVMRVALKPPSSITVLQKTVDTSGEERDIQVHGRHDPCICPRAVPVVESMIAISLMDLYLIHRGVCVL